ncbi:MAG: hypothetical protein V4656_08915 [Pseudomonadota bacterium]
MDPTRATSSYADYPVRPRDTAAPKIVAPPAPSRQEGVDTPVTDNGHMREYLQAKPDQVKNRETDEQVTRQRVQDKAQGTMFDVRT